MNATANFAHVESERKKREPRWIEPPAPAAVFDARLHDPKLVERAARIVPAEAERISIGGCQIGYRHQSRPRTVSWRMNGQIVADVEAAISLRHGGPCDTDDGEPYLILAANALVPGVIARNAMRRDPLAAALVRVRQWAEAWAPLVSAVQVTRIIERAICDPRRFRADTAAKLIRLTMAERMAARITTIGAIDCDQAERERLRKERRKERDRQAKEAQRRAEGRKPRAQYEAEAITRTKPWLAAGFNCKRTWERHGKPRPSPVASVSASIIRTKVMSADRLATRPEALADTPTQDIKDHGSLAKGTSDKRARRNGRSQHARGEMAGENDSARPSTRKAVKRKAPPHSWLTIRTAMMRNDRRRARLRKAKRVKPDADLIAEAIAQGRVTKCPPSSALTFEASPFLTALWHDAGNTTTKPRPTPRRRRAQRNGSKPRRCSKAATRATLEAQAT